MPPGNTNTERDSTRTSICLVTFRNHYSLETSFSPQRRAEVSPFIERGHLFRGVLLDDEMS
jgi:hypothetical protein